MIKLPLSKVRVQYNSASFLFLCEIIFLHFLFQKELKFCFSEKNSSWILPTFTAQKNLSRPLDTGKKNRQENRKLSKNNQNNKKNHRQFYMRIEYKEKRRFIFAFSNFRLYFFFVCYCLLSWILLFVWWQSFQQLQAKMWERTEILRLLSGLNWSSSLINGVNVRGYLYDFFSIISFLRSSFHTRTHSHKHL